MPEGARQEAAFDRYWGLGPERSIERLRGELAKDEDGQRSVPSVRTLYEWSRRYRWQDRIARLERQAREAADEARVEVLREMYDRQAREALLLQQRGTEWLAEFAAGQASPEAAIRAIVEGAKLERLARGEPSDRTAQEGANDVQQQLARFTDEELELLVQQAECLVDGAGEEESS